MGRLHAFRLLDDCVDQQEDWATTEEVKRTAARLGHSRLRGGEHRARRLQGCQPAGRLAAPEAGLMWANMRGAFQVGNALTGDGGPSSWMRPPPIAWPQVRWPACHLTKASASAVMYRSSSKPGFVLQISASPSSMSSQ